VFGVGKRKRKREREDKDLKKRKTSCVCWKKKMEGRKRKKEGGKEVKGLRVNTCSSPPLSLEGVRVVFLLFFP
jgi:hypothetical protein